MKTLHLEYNTVIRQYCPKVRDYALVKEINRSFMDSKDFWGYSSMYVMPDNLERFILAADLLGVEVTVCHVSQIFEFPMGLLK